MKRLIPGSLALQSFEAAARHLSFTRAAVELCVTQGAISRQVAQLEAQLGVALFARVRQRLQLTDAGRAYLTRIEPALRELAAASTELLIHRGAGGVLRIASLPTFNAKWLVPRLPRFAQAHPEVRLEFFPFVQGYDFSRPDLDCAIRYGSGAWPGAESVYIDGRELLVVGPQQADRKALDPARATLLHHTTVPDAWREWLGADAAVNA
jgi:LysR family glycine cleavage system transcriptional activator